MTEMKLELPPQEPQVRSSVVSQRKTRNRPRCHARYVHIHLTAISRDWELGNSFPVSRFEEVCASQLDDCPAVTEPFEVFGSSIRRSANPGGKNYAERMAEMEGTLSVRYDFVAEKAADIYSEERALSETPVADIAEAMREAFTQVVAEIYTEQAEELRFRHANSVLHHMVAETRDKAKEAVRYDQRMAAIKAEFEAEKQVQAKVQIEELRKEKDPKFDDGTPIDPRCVEAAVKALPEACKGGEGFFGRRHREDQNVDREDIK